MSSSQEEKKPHFFKFFLPGLTDQFLRIPQAFLKNIDDGSHGTVSLTGPSGNVWHVNLVANMNGLFFQDGWKEFVRDHFLEVGYFLVFRYDGNLRFTVQIFDTSGCEKGNSFYANCCQESSSFEEDKGNDKVKEGVAEALIVSPYKDYEDVSSGRSGEHNQITIEDLEDEKPIESSKRISVRISCKSGSNCNQVTIEDSEGEKPIESGKRSTVRISCKSRSNCNQITTEDSEDDKPIESSKRSPMRISCKSGSNYLTVDDKQSAQGSVREKPISSKRYMTRLSYTVERNQLAIQDCCQVILSCSSRNNQLAVQRPLFKKPASSTKTSMKCLSREVCSNSLTICDKQTAQRSLRKGPVNSPKRNVIRPSRLVRSSCSIRNNQLAAWQPLLKKSSGSTKRSPKKPSHQLLSKTLARYKKQPSRQVFSKTLARYKNQVVNRSLLATKRKMGSSPLEAWQSLCKKRLISTERSTKRPSRQGQSNSFTGSEAKLKCQTKTDFQLRVGALISQRRRVTEEEKARVLDDAKSFKSKNPSVAVVMRAGYVYVGFFMVLPRKFVTSYLPKEDRVMTVLDPSGRCWTMKYLARKTLGALSGGWASFSLANNLEESDVCVFERIKKDKLQVHIFRVVEEITPLIKVVSSRKKKN
ncbi:B3 domain-containing protein Os11g0197600-like isoform X2 [Magnolia sinica]|uniref:B3 domain-containing protein Os11g0197600-like isoform X2 n=1 Tax=Magnolia sinica TaxID=86752 RepID=UPI00265989DC|nr:B3 domain-containing protein Os11g0197600-like isoform X2 [Magnolia sinica]